MSPEIAAPHTPGIDPNCPHANVEPFEIVGVVKSHCWDCGVVFEPDETPGLEVTS